MRLQSGSHDMLNVAEKKSEGLCMRDHDRQCNRSLGHMTCLVSHGKKKNNKRSLSSAQHKEKVWDRLKKNSVCLAPEVLSPTRALGECRRRTPRGRESVGFGVGLPGIAGAMQSVES